VKFRCLLPASILELVSNIALFACYPFAVTRKQAVGAILIIAMPWATFGATGNQRITRYSLEQGLSQISVNALVQDSYGFIWIGTQDGLNRFDGYDFLVYRNQPSDAGSLSHSYVQSVIEDKEGNVWIGTRDGLNKLDRSSDKFVKYLNQPGNPESVSSNDIHRILQDREGAIWVGTGRGLDRLDTESGTFTRFPFPGDAGHDISGAAGFIYEDDQGRLWFGTTAGVFILDRQTERYTRVYHHDRLNPGSISGNNARSVLHTGRGHVLVGTSGGLDVFDRVREVFRPLNFRHGNDAVKFSGISSMAEDRNGTLWVGTERGLYFFVARTGEPFPGVPEIHPHFSNHDVTAVIADHSGNLWVGTLGGLYMIDSREKFNTWRVHDYLPDAPRAASLIASIYSFPEGECWLGTWGAGLYRIDRETGNIIHYHSESPLPNRRISNDFVHVIHTHSSGRTIIGTRNGLDIFMGEQAGFVPFCPLPGNGDCSVFRSNRIYSIYEDSRHVLWVGTRNGLYSFPGDSMKRYLHNPSDTTGIPSNQVNDIIECREGFLWIATDNGLARYDRRTGKFTSFRKDPAHGRFSLSSNEITCLHEDSSGNLWIGTVSGLNRYFRTTGSFIVFSEMEGLPNNLIYAILEDDNGRLWMSTNRGLARFDPASLEIVNYDVADGLQSYEFNLGARFKGHNGELFFGGINGVNAFFPDKIGINEYIPPVVISRFEIFSPLESRILVNLRDGDEVVLPYDRNSISLEFAALDFTRPGKNMYAYILEGLDNRWTRSGNRRIANYSRIPPGSYVFRVRGSNSDGIWNEHGTALRITVLAPWWQSLYAWIFYSLLFMFLIYLTGLYSTRRLRTANLLLKEKELDSAEISRQKEELILKNKNITDSINYAKRIQMAIMPQSSHFRELFPESFVFYKPKDIVSGDFYWMNQKNDKIFFAVVDCTGHGVPGAFMSVIGYELLRNIINVKGIEKPSEILNQLNMDFSTIFNPGSDRDFAFRDGMDIGFCVIDRKNARLEFAGAFSPLYLVRNNTVIEIKGNRFSVGLMEDLIDEKFENHFIQLHKGDMIYLFSDGYPDQFGGEEGKKFKYRRFRHLLLNIHSLPASRQEELLNQSIIQWMGDHEQVDDILVLGIRPGIGPGMKTKP
jgi:ligand-binding sensor domain-containing protein/serine phosphatase RsbU (regulator of sigma subunit)